MARLPNFLVIIRSEKLSGKGQGRGGRGAKKRTFRFGKKNVSFPKVETFRFADYKLNGRFTALQMAGEEIKSQNALQSQSLNILTMKADAILSVNTETRNIADDTRDLIANSYLELVQISENTGAIVKPIQQIQKDIAEVKKNTSKL